MMQRVVDQRIIVGNHHLFHRAGFHLLFMEGAYPQGDGVRVHGALDDREEALAQLVKINLLAQRRGESLDLFDRLPIMQVETSLNALLDKHTYRFKDDHPGKSGGDRDDKRSMSRIVRSLSPRI